MAPNVAIEYIMPSGNTGSVGGPCDIGVVEKPKKLDNEMKTKHLSH